jgi:hypothetical protein
MSIFDFPSTATTGTSHHIISITLSPSSPTYLSNQRLIFQKNISNSRSLLEAIKGPPHVFGSVRLRDSPTSIDSTSPNQAISTSTN